MNIFSLDNKVAIVTGAARGNGKAIAEGFLEAGAFVYFVDILEGEVSSHNAKYIKADITNKDDLERVVSQIYREQNKIDILVNNAGITISEPSESYSQESWDKTYRVNLKAAFDLSQMVAKYMIAQKSGAIINITSLGAERGFPNNPAYVAFKGGLKQLSKALASDWAQYNIRVNNLVPGYIRTKMQEKSWNDPVLNAERKNKTILGRWGEPRDLVGPAIFLASDASSFTTAHDLYVDGGWLAKGL